MKHDTDDLLKQLKSVDGMTQLDSYLDTIARFPVGSFAEYASRKMKERGINRAALYKRAKIERTYLYQILDGRKNPGRDKIIAIALALELGIDEAQTALEIAHEGILYPKDRRDAILIYSLNIKSNILTTNALLEHYGELQLR